MLKLVFTDFHVDRCSSDSSGFCDHVIIRDGDGTILMDKTSGSSTDSHQQHWGHLGHLGPFIVYTSISNRVDIIFKTDHVATLAGWSLDWTAVTAGLKPIEIVFHLFPCLDLKLNCYFSRISLPLPNLTRSWSTMLSPWSP